MRIQEISETYDKLCNQGYTAHRNSHHTKEKYQLNDHEVETGDFFDIQPGSRDEHFDVIWCRQV